MCLHDLSQLHLLQLFLCVFFVFLKLDCFPGLCFRPCVLSSASAAVFLHSAMVRSFVVPLTSHLYVSGGSSTVTLGAIPAVLGKPIFRTHALSASLGSNSVFAASPAVVLKAFANTLACSLHRDLRAQLPRGVVCLLLHKVLAIYGRASNKEYGPRPSKDVSCLVFFVCTAVTFSQIKHAT